jgi:hypothetical protein
MPDYKRGDALPGAGGEATVHISGLITVLDIARR